MSISLLLPVSRTVGSVAGRAVASLAELPSFVAALDACATDAGCPEERALKAVSRDSSLRDASADSSKTDEAMEHFRAIVIRHFAAAGIDLSRPIELKEDDFGRIVEVSGHPDRELIERILSREPDVAEAFRQAVSAVQRQNQQRDPWAIMPEHTHLARSFSLVLDDKEIRAEPA